MPLFERIRAVLLAVVLISVLLVGAPVGSALNGRFQSALEPLGIDVAIRPITADMRGLFDTGQTPLYRQQIRIVLVRSGYPIRRVAFDTLPLEHGRIPMLLLSERIEMGSFAPELHHAVCALLRFETNLPNFDGFVVELPDAPEAGRDSGFNTFIPCATQ